jgi:cbb3-type cytochrome oxidase maturation protein
MNVLIVLVPLALGLGLTGLAAFLWSLRNGQYDDIDGAALRILPDDDIERLVGRYPPVLRFPRGTIISFLDPILALLQLIAAAPRHDRHR